MLGSITGDIIGSIYEWDNIKTKSFEPLFSPKSFFTDDSVLTIALMESILKDTNFSEMMKLYYHEYPFAGYGGSFHKWATGEVSGAYNSFGNGSAMRTSPIGFICNTLEETLKKAKLYAEVTHNHPEGIKGAQAASACIFMARMGASKEEIKGYISQNFNYDLNRTADDIRPEYAFDVTCQGTVPEAIIAFLDSSDFEDAIRTAISLGGDSDTLTCITGGIAEAHYGDIPQDIANQAMLKLTTPELRNVVLDFYQKYRPSNTILNAYEYAKNESPVQEYSFDVELEGKQSAFWRGIVKNNNSSWLEKILQKIK